MSHKIKKKPKEAGAESRASGQEEYSLKEGVASRRIVKRLLREEGGSVRMVQVNLAEAPLDWLMRRGHILQRHFDAAEQLRLDFERAQLGPRMTMRWEERTLDKNARALPPRVVHTENQQRAHARFHAALDHAGPGLQDILWRVVCHHEKLELIEKSMQWPVRSGKVVLRIALERVADFYLGLSG
jgi:hypothetical protein